MKRLRRTAFDPKVTWGKLCIRGMRVTVGMIVWLIATGYTKQEVLGMCPYLEAEDIDEAIQYAAWRICRDNDNRKT